MNGGEKFICASCTGGSQLAPLKEMLKVRLLIPVTYLASDGCQRLHQRKPSRPIKSLHLMCQIENPAEKTPASHISETVLTTALQRAPRHQWVLSHQFELQRAQRHQWVLSCQFKRGAKRGRTDGTPLCGLIRWLVEQHRKWQGGLLVGGTAPLPPSVKWQCHQTAMSQRQ